jgi:hypothetical protein
MRRILLFPAVLTGAFLLGSAAPGSLAHATPAAKSALNTVVPITETSNAGVTEVGRRGRKFRGSRSFKRHGRSYSRRGFKRYRYGKYRRHRNRDIFIGSLLGLGLLAAPSYGYNRYYGGGSCSYWSRRCADNWGYRNSDYYGCMRYHGC